MKNTKVIFGPTLAEAGASAGIDLPDPKYTAVNELGFARFATNNSVSDKAGYMKTLPDGAVVFGCYRSNVQYIYQQRKHGAPPPTPAEIKRLKTQATKARKQAEATLDAMHAQKAKMLEAEFAALPLAFTDNPYCTRKGIKPFGCKEGRHKELKVPVYDGDGNLQSVQSIYADGSKKFASGAKMKGGRFVFGDLPNKREHIILAEGFATAASIYKNALRKPAVVCCFSGANLAVVAADLRQRYPYYHIVIAGDLDASGIGEKYAQAAAEAAAPNSQYVLPEFPDGRTSGDFNDLAQLKGRHD